MKKLKGYMHGVNLGGWLSQCDHTKERYDFFITESDIEVIKSWGMDHIRVPVDYDLVEDAQGNYKEDGFAYIQKAIEWCKKNKLNMVLDLHKTFGYSFDSGEGELGFFEKKEYQDRFYKLWEQFAIRFGKNDNMLVSPVRSPSTNWSMTTNYSSSPYPSPAVSSITTTIRLVRFVSSRKKG